MRARTEIILITGTLLLSAIACGTTSDPGARSKARDSTRDAGTAGANNTAGTVPDAGEPTLVLDAGTSTDAAPCDITCSPDLHDVTTCSGEVIKTCPDNKACAAGECIEPCEAAKVNGSSIGCEFYSVAPAANHSGGSCFAAMLANTWTSPIAIQVGYSGKPLNVADFARTVEGSGEALTYKPLPSDGLPPGQVAVLFLANDADSPDYACPTGIKPGITTSATLSGTGIGKAFRITTSAPVSAYDIFPYGGAKSFITSATLLIPTSAWGTNYIATDAYPSLNLGNTEDSPFTQIVATQDDTQVTINPRKAIVAGTGVEASAAGQPHTYTLSKGQVLQFAQHAKLAGSAISSDKPISVWGGSSCMNIPTLECCCDSAHQQFLPIRTLGFEHVGARYRDRMPGLEESVPWSVVGTVDNTTLTYDPAPPAGAPLTINSGQVLTFDAQTPFTVRSDGAEQPFHVIAHMTAGRVVCPERQAIPKSLENRCGDPDFVNSVPPQQWLKQYVFLTDPTYLNTHLVFTRQKAKDGAFKDVTLACLGTISGWKRVSPDSPFEVTGVDIVEQGKAIGNCSNGLHTAKSETPFGLTVWGWDAWTSYAYPAGMSLRPINTIIVRPDPK